jgi:hypothetical protein
METVQELTAVIAEETKAIKVNAKVIAKTRSRFSFASQAAGFEEARYFWMSVLMTAQSCIGAIACMFILYGGGNVIALAACAAVTMGSNAMFIGLAGPRTCLAVLYFSVALNIFFIVSNPM